MTRSFSRWLASMALVVGALSPNLGQAQVVLSLSDEDDVTYPIALSSEDDSPSVSSSSSASDLMVSSDDSCFACCDTGCNTCCYVPRNWVSADYLLWWTKGNAMPPLLTTSPAGTAQVAAGVLPGATPLFGGTDIDDEVRSGLRIGFGHWSDPAGTVGWQVNYFSVFDDDNSGDIAATGVGGAPILARPFFNVDINAPDSRLISFPNVVDGTININSSSEMHSVSWLARTHWRSGSRGRVDLLGGYRFFRFREGLRIQESLTTTDPGGVIPIGTTLNIEDEFIAKNDFHGGDFGFIAEFWNPGMSVEILAKVALGNLRRSADITGSTVTDTPPVGGAITTNGGLLALPTNIGSRRGNDFAALPEFGINLKFEPRQNVSVNVGYSLLMLNDVVRTGELIDTSVNPTQLTGGPLVGAARPTSQFGNAETDFWAQGLNFGLTFSR